MYATPTRNTETTTETRQATKSRPGRAPLRPDILKVAATLRAGTKVAAREALTAGGFTRRPIDIDAVLVARDEIHNARENRFARKFEARCGHPPPRFGNYDFHPGVAPTPRLHQRLRAVRVEAVRATASRLFRHGAAGGHSMTVTFAASAAEVRYCVTMDRNWDTYAGNFKGWAAKEDHHALCVPADWRIRVFARGLADLGGMMTLDAHALESLAGVQLFAATWASQGRGYNVEAHRGFIALVDGEHYHAETAVKALRGIQRKVRARHSYAADYESTVDDFIVRYSGLTAEVTLDDARLTGSCEYGIRSWCERVGLDYKRGEAPLQAVLNAFRLYPQIEVRRAVMHAARRARRSQKEIQLLAA